MPSIRKRLFHKLRGLTSSAKSNLEELLSEYGDQHGGKAELLKSTIIRALTHPEGPQQGLVNVLAQHGSAVTKHLGRAIVRKATPYIQKLIPQISSAFGTMQEYLQDTDPQPRDTRDNPSGYHSSGKYVIGNDQPVRTQDANPDYRRGKLGDTYHKQFSSVPPVKELIHANDFSTSYSNSLGSARDSVTGRVLTQNPAISNFGWYFRPVGKGTNAGLNYPMYGNNSRQPAAGIDTPELLENLSQHEANAKKVPKRQKKLIVIPKALDAGLTPRGARSTELKPKKSKK